jgi:hypothetical protein
LGLPGIAIDVPALIGLALRATNEYATYYGYDVGLEEERSIVMQVLTLGSMSTTAPKSALFASLARASSMLAKKAAWAELERIAAIEAMRKLAEQLGIRLTKAKLADAIPLVGGAIGGPFNAWFLAGVTKSASMIYRERFLREQYDLWTESTPNS